MTACDILVSGTGGFAARIAFDIAATASTPVTIVIAGRNRGRLDWLRTAANARASIFRRPARFESFAIDLLEPDAAARLLTATQPRVLVQAASIQTSQVIAQTGNAWTRLVAEGGLSATAVFQALISSRVAAAITSAGRPIAFVNCGFSDVVNGMITAQGHAVACGMGNVAILSNVFAGSASVRPGAEVRTLAHYQTIGAWRRPPSERTGPTPRVWVDGAEVEDVFSRFADVQLTPEPAIEISGASGVPMMLAMASGGEWRGHVPGPNGLPGGYPVRLSAGKVTLDLPAGVSAQEAIAWNRAFEERNGLTVTPDGRAIYSGRLRDGIAAHDAGLADGFAIADLESVCTKMLALRDRLMAQP